MVQNVPQKMSSILKMLNSMEYPPLNGLVFSYGRSKNGKGIDAGKRLATTTGISMVALQLKTFTSFSGSDHYSVTEQFGFVRTMTASIGTPSLVNEG
jgi:hypothetical protein